MDCDSVYIKQCEKATEIQALFTTPLPPATFWARKVEWGYSEGVTGYNYRKLPEWVILPLQDQLQEMIDWTDEKYRFDGMVTVPVLSTIGKLGNLMNFANDEWRHKRTYPSMEQLWLAFVMHEKFGKHWNGKEWSEIKEVAGIA